MSNASVFMEFEGSLDSWREDAGRALIAQLVADPTDVGMFVRIHSWDAFRRHEDLERLLRQGKRVRVTIEIVERHDELGPG